MKYSSRLFSSLALAISSIALLLFGLTGTAKSKSEEPSASLPGVSVQAPKQIVRPQNPEPRAVPPNTGRHTVSHRTSPTPAAPSAGQGSVMERLHKLERESGSCVGGCQSSFPKGNLPWVGCSASAWPMPSAGCRNPRKFTSYTQCTETNYFLAWKPMEVWWYCSALALNK